MKIEFEIKGVEELQAKLIRQKVRVKTEARKIASEEARKIMAESLDEVPRDTGALAASAFIKEQSDGNVLFGYGQDKVQVNAKTGNLTSSYMLTVHEDLSIHHPIGKAKFLEDPIRRHQETLAKSFAAKLQRSFRNLFKI